MNRNVKIHLAILVVPLFLLLIIESLSAQEDATISFAEAWQRVRSENDALKAARAKVKQAEHIQDSRRDLYYPEVSLSAKYIYLDDAVELSPNELFESMEGGEQAGLIAADISRSYGLTPTQLNAGLTSTIAERENVTSSILATWPIYTGGRISAAQDIASGQLGEAEHSLKREASVQFENLVRYYFGAVLAKQVLTTYQEVEAGLKKHRDHAVLLEEQGQIARVERMQSEAAFDKAVVERKKASRDLEIAQVALSKILKSSQLIFPADPLFIEDNLPSVKQFVGETLAHNPGLAILDKKKEQAKGLVTLQKGQYYPTVALFGNYSLYEEDDLASKLAPEWLVGIGVKIPLFERSGRSGKLKAAKSALLQIDHLRDQAESDLSVLVEKTHRQAQQALEEFEGLLSSRQLAEETVKLRIKAFGQGLSTSLDVVDAELFLAEIKTQRALAVYNYIIALGKLGAISNRPETFLNFQNTQGIEEH